MTVLDSVPVLQLGWYMDLPSVVLSQLHIFITDSDIIKRR